MIIKQRSHHTLFLECGFLNKKKIICTCVIDAEVLKAGNGS